MQPSPHNILAALTIAAALLAGCAQSPQAATQTASAGAAGSAPHNASAAGIQSDMAKVNADPSLNSVQKQIMLNQMSHARSMQAGGK